MLDLHDSFDLGERVYINGAAHGPLPRPSRAAAERALAWKSDPTGLDDRQYFELPDRIRAAGAALIGAQPHDIAVGTGASHGISLVSCGLEWASGDHVVVPRGEFPANSLPWLALRSRGVEVEFVDADRVVEAIRPNTRVVSVGHVNFATGRRLDLEPIGEACTELGVLFVVDASQSLGSLAFDAQRCRASVVAVAGYKWLLSPYGTGLTYVRPEWVERFRLPAFNWSTIVGAEDFNQLVDLEPRHRPGAIRFDSPETAAFVNGMAMAESLELLVQVGVPRVEAHSLELIDRLVHGLPRGFRCDSSLDPSKRSAIVRLVADDEATTESAYRHVRASGVTVSLRERGLRVSPGLWNTAGDIEALLDSLAAYVGGT